MAVNSSSTAPRSTLPPPYPAKFADPAPKRPGHHRTEPSGGHRGGPRDAYQRLDLTVYAPLCAAISADSAAVARRAA